MPPRQATAKKSKAKKAPAARKKTPVKKTAAKKTTAKAKKAPAKKSSLPKTLKEPMTKTEVLNHVAETTELSKKQVQSVIDELSNIIELHVKKRSVGQFTLPGLLKVQVQKKPATKARKGISPFTGEEMMFKAKPARNVVKVRPLKKLKDYAS
jgi:nucleoid DNA-binding protein